MKKKNIMSLILSLVVVFNMVLFVSATDYYSNADDVYGTSELSAEDALAFSADIDTESGLDENPADNALTEGDAIASDATTDSIVAELESDLIPLTPGNSGENQSADSKLDLKTVLIVAAVVALAIIIVIAVVMLMRKKKNADTDSDKDVETEKSSRAQKINIEIPVGEAETINYEYEFRDTAFAQSGSSAPQINAESADISDIKIDNTRDIIMSIYKGEATEDAFTGKVVPLVLTNVYDLQINTEALPNFTVGNDLYTADYILVNDNLLYLNYYVFRKPELKLYSDIVAVEKCFDIFSTTGAVAKPSNQNICDLEPAVFEVGTEGFTVCQKGKITVE